jgi:predicted Zn-dependent protease
VRVFSGSWISGALAPETEEVADPRAEGVAQLLERIARYWPENPYTLRVAIYEESTPNALAFPGGFIVVTTGLLDQVESENELAFVLAHELGHFHNRDHLRGIGRGVVFALALSAMGFSGTDAAAQLAALSGQLAARGFDRDQEGDADRFGLALVQQEYGHVAGALDFFERLPDPGSFVEKQIVHYLATHPLDDDRIEALRAQALARSWSQVGTVVPLGAH